MQTGLFRITNASAAPSSLPISFQPHCRCLASSASSLVHFTFRKKRSRSASDPGSGSSSSGTSPPVSTSSISGIGHSRRGRDERATSSSERLWHERSFEERG